MFEIPVSILAAMMFAGIAVSTISALIAIPRLSAQQSVIVEMREEVEAKEGAAADLHQQIEASTSTVVGLKDLLAKAEIALTDARGQIYMRDVKTAAAQRVIDGMRHQIAQHQIERALAASRQPEKSVQSQELHAD